MERYINIEKIRSLYNKEDWEYKEGYVVRTFSGFHYKNFPMCVGKFVRERHVLTTKHWMHGQLMERNQLL